MERITMGVEAFHLGVADLDTFLMDPCVESALDLRAVPLLAEMPNINLSFAVDQIRRLSRVHPEWPGGQPFKAVLDDDHAYLSTQSRRHGEAISRCIRGYR